MKVPKKYKTEQTMKALAKENGQTFSLLMQLAREVHELGGVVKTLATVTKELPGYEDAVKKLKEAQDASESTPEQSPKDDLILET